MLTFIFLIQRESDKIISDAKKERADNLTVIRRKISEINQCLTQITELFNNYNRKFSKLVEEAEILEAADSRRVYQLFGQLMEIRWTLQFFQIKIFHEFDKNENVLVMIIKVKYIPRNEQDLFRDDRGLIVNTNHSKLLGIIPFSEIPLVFKISNVAKKEVGDIYEKGMGSEKP